MPGFPDNQAGDEINQLIVLFNRMLARIETLIGAHARVVGQRRARSAHADHPASGQWRSWRCDPTPVPEVCREALADCLEESDRVMAILNTLMDISEAETGTMKLAFEDVNLAELIHEVTDLYEHVADEAKVRVTTDVPQDLSLRADRARLRQVVANLVDNAIKYTPSGGRIEIDATRAEREVLLLVRDSGVGIPADELPRIWDRLYRGDKSRSQRGLGLGLSLVKAVVQAHQGRVDASSDSGRRFGLYPRPASSLRRLSHGRQPVKIVIFRQARGNAFALLCPPFAYSFFHAPRYRGGLRVKDSDETNKAFRYRLDRKIRASVMWGMSWITHRSREERVDLQRQNIKRILLVRSIFRMGDSILATPAILLLRKNFPEAKIDFVGPRISKALFQNLPIDRHYEVYQSFPKVCWSYLVLLKRIRAAKYDLAIDVSGSSAALGSFIVGFSRARFCAGIRGKWDRWFNIRLPRPATKNKYGNLSELVASMGLESPRIFPRLILSPREMEEGRIRIRALRPSTERPIVGVFVGGRKTRGKRWPTENFLQLVVKLRGDGIKPIIFVGPEEKDLLWSFQEALRYRVPVVYEPDARAFASLVANCDLFVACDSGPVHLACALRVRTVAIFLKNNFDHWGPPAELGRIVYHKDAVSAESVFEGCCRELSIATPADANMGAEAAGSFGEKAANSPDARLSEVHVSGVSASHG